MLFLMRHRRSSDCMAEIVPYNLPHFQHPCGSDAGDTSPWMGAGRTMQEQLSRATHGAVADDCMDARGRATHGAVAEEPAAASNKPLDNISQLHKVRTAITEECHGKAL